MLSSATTVVGLDARMECAQGQEETMGKGHQQIMTGVDSSWAFSGQGEIQEGEVEGKDEKVNRSTLKKLKDEEFKMKTNEKMNNKMTKKNDFFNFLH